MQQTADLHSLLVSTLAVVSIIGGMSGIIHLAHTSSIGAMSRARRVDSLLFLIVMVGGGIRAFVPAQLDWVPVSASLCILGLACGRIWGHRESEARSVEHAERSTRASATNQSAA